MHRPSVPSNFGKQNKGLYFDFNYVHYSNSQYPYLNLVCTINNA